ncbi:hypothetical protein DFJ73DRAFT_910594 [Zopfochytrium polystomum]|nr:hypothetical protein DFJ73DRAFT_910594 [Zopfochytrium polystomum]
MPYYDDDDDDDDNGFALTSLEPPPGWVPDADLSLLSGPPDSQNESPHHPSSADPYRPHRLRLVDAVADAADRPPPLAAGDRREPAELFALRSSLRQLPLPPPTSFHRHPVADDGSGDGDGGSSSAADAGVPTLKGTTSFERTQQQERKSKRHRRRRERSPEAPDEGDSASDVSQIDPHELHELQEQQQHQHQRDGGSGRLRGLVNGIVGGLGLGGRPRRQPQQGRFTLAPHGFRDRLFLEWGSSESAKVAGDRLQKNWDEERERAKARRAAAAAAASAKRPAAAAAERTGAGAAASHKMLLLTAIRRTFGPQFAYLAGWKLLWTVFMYFGGYFVLRWLIQYCEERHAAAASSASSDAGAAAALLQPPPVWRGQVTALGLFLCSLIGTLCLNQLSVQATRIGVQCRAALMVLVFRKSLRLSYVKGGVKDIVNLIASECNRVAEAAVNWHFLWSATIDFAAIFILATVDLSYAAVPAVLIAFFVLLPLQLRIASDVSKENIATTSRFTRRVHLISEALTAVKLVKFYGWEPYYVAKITDARTEELAGMRRALFGRSVVTAVVHVAPVAAMLVAVGVAIVGKAQDGSGGVALSAASVFAALSLFNFMRYPLMKLPSAVNAFKAADVSLERLEDFFCLPEVDDPPEPTPSENPDLLMDIKSAEFQWDGDIDHPDIHDLTLEILRGQVIAVVGDLPSGRSLIASLLRQTKLASGTYASHASRLGYVPQEPWLVNATLRDNILFGLDMDSNRYADVIRLCGLTRDLMLLSQGDDAIVTDINLSVAQRQRISLARCLYYDPEVLMLEDCLSDFDAATARRVFRECIRNQMLKQKAVVLVTQQKQFLPECDLILVLKNGKVIERGTYVELKTRKVNFSAWVSDYVPIEDDPSGVLDKVNELRLYGPPATSTVRGPTAFSHITERLVPDEAPAAESFRPPGRFSPFNPRASRKAHLGKPSPLGTAVVISAEAESSGDESSLSAAAGGAASGEPESVEEANQMTMRALAAMNVESIQSDELLNEHTISKMIERGQASLLTSGPASRPPANFENQDPIARTIEANQLTVHSLHGLQGALRDRGIKSRGRGNGFWVPYDVYLSSGFGRWFSGATIVGFFLVQAVRTFSVASNNTTDPVNPGSLRGSGSTLVYLGLFLLLVFTANLRGVLFSTFVIRISRSLHDRAMKSVLRAPMSFYDTTPLGCCRTARCSFGAVAMVCGLVPWFLLTLPFYVLVAAYVVKMCHRADKELQKLEAKLNGISTPFFSPSANNKAPMFAHLSSTLEGLFSIRLYGAQDRFDGFNRSLIDADHKALYAQQDLVACVAVYVAALLAVSVSVPHELSPFAAGLAVTSAQQLLWFVPYVVRMGGDVHFAVKSAAAVVKFIDGLPSEMVNLKAPEKGVEGWPSKGAIEFKQVSLRYHRYGVAVLKSVTFRIRPGEKVGIVGRTGSGKTSLLMALLRLAEHTEGDILIDGVDTRTLNLASLRGRIAVIPQEPVLLTGTIRANLDPFGLKTDEEMAELPQGLETPIVENGKTFSLAERQLFCVARAILLHTRVVVFDEPVTAADNDTDALIQQTIVENFKDATVIVLASRFRMIAESDRILVMEAGRVVEFDSPVNLFSDPRSRLSLMVSQTGNVDAEKLLQIARVRAERVGRTTAAGGGGSGGGSGGTGSTAAGKRRSGTNLRQSLLAHSVDGLPTSVGEAVSAIPITSLHPSSTLSSASASASAAAAAAAARRRSLRTSGLGGNGAADGFSGSPTSWRSESSLHSAARLLKKSSSLAVSESASSSSSSISSSDGGGDGNQNGHDAGDDGDDEDDARRASSSSTPSPPSPFPQQLVGGGTGSVRKSTAQMPKSLEQIFGGMGGGGGSD